MVCYIASHMKETRDLSRWVVASLILVAAGSFSRAADQETIEELVTRVGRARWTYDNSVELLADPRVAWQVRVDMAREARHHILISVFSWHNDDYGRAYRKVLDGVVKERKEAGAAITVRVLVDASALGQFSPSFSALERQGAKVRGFNRSSWGMTPLYYGRMHDKIMVVDGREAIVGGRNFSDDYYDSEHWWLDFGVKVRGSAVDDLQMIFLKSWEFTEFNRKAGRFLLPQEMLLDDLRIFWSTGRYPGGKSPLQQFMTTAYFPGWKKAPGSVPVAILYDNPMLRSRAASTDLVAALAERAETRIDLMTPFPNFPSELTEALAAAVARGVRVRLFVNDRESAIRSGPFLLAGYPTLIRLIEAGAEVWAWRANKNVLAQIAQGGCELPLAPPLALHGKLVLVDDEISIVHSSNFNIRSTFYNTEAGAVVLDRAFNRELSDLLDDLVDFRDVELSCTDGNGYLEIPALVRQLGPEDIPEMKEELGGKQPFLDAWSVAW